MTKSEIWKQTLQENEDILDHLRLAGLWKDDQPLRLHLGCGENHFDGYINIDYPPSEHAVQIRVGADLFADVSRLDFPESTVDEIRLHHVFEHFSRPKALALLIRWQGWLKIGGRLYIETPDITGCAKALISDRSYKTKQAVLRHAFGSQEAAWAFHLDGWYKEKFEYVLTQFGFLVQCQNVQWEGEPWLANVHALAVKQRSIPRKALLTLADGLLQDSMVADVPGERMMHQVWGGMLREELLNTHRENTIDLSAEGLPADIPILIDSKGYETLGYDNIEFKENGEYLILSKILRRGDLIFDVGANKGHWSKLVLEMNPQAMIYAFEPVPETFAILQKTLSDSKTLRFNLALSADDGEKPFYHWNDSSVTGELSSFYRRPDVERSMQASVRPIVVKSRTLDTFCREHEINQIDFLKIDTEGAELDVLRGASALLEAKRVRVLQFEYGGTYLDSHITLKQIYEFLQEKGYQVYRIIPEGLLYIPCWRGALENYRYANYLAVASGMGAVWDAHGLKEGNKPYKISKNKNLDSLVAVIFSKDRALQLDAALRSFFDHCTDAETLSIKVIYKGSTPADNDHYDQLKREYPAVAFLPEIHFKNDLLSALNDQTHILFLVDDNLVVRDFSLEAVLRSLEGHPKALGFSLRLGKNTTYCYMHNKNQKLPEFFPAGINVLKFNWTTSELDFGYPLELSSSVYRTADILPLLTTIDFHNPNTLEACLDFHKDRYKSDKNELLCFDVSVSFCNPVNKVQTTFEANRGGQVLNYSSAALSALFQQGCRINLDRTLGGILPYSCHQEVPLYFTPEPVGGSEPESGLLTSLVSVIILSYNGVEHIRTCLESIKRNTPENHEIIVVDNAKNDGSREYLRTLPEIHLIENPQNVGPAVSRAQAMSLARGDYMAFLDDDTIVPKGWLTKFIQLAQEHPEIGMWGPRSNYASGLQLVQNVTYHNLEELEAFAQHWFAQHQGQLTGVFRLVSFCLFIKRSVVEKIGTFDGRFGLFGFEDDDFSLRAYVAGFKPTIAHEIFIHHTGGPQGRGNKEYNQRLLDSWAVFKKKWDLPEALPYGVSYEEEKIIHQLFDPEKHYIPLPGRSSVEKCLYADPLEKRIGQVFTTARQAAAEGKWAEAEGAFHDLLKENPDLGIAHAGLGSILIAKGDYPAAVTHLNRAVELLPDEMELNAQLAEALYLSGHIPSARQTLLTALEQAPENVNLLLKFIDLSRAENQVGQVAEYTLRAVKVAPDNPDVLVAFGRLGFNSGNHEAFHAAFDKLKQVSPEHPLLKEWQEIWSRAENIQIDNTDVNFTSDENHACKPPGFKGLTSVIIALSAESKNLKQCFQRIQKHTPEPYELIMIGKEVEGLAVKWRQDAGVVEETFKCLSTDKQLSLAESYNLGLKETSGDPIVLMSDEVLVTKDWLSGLHDCLTSTANSGLVVPMIINGEGPQLVADATYKIDDLDGYASDFRTRYRHRRIPVLYPSPVCWCLKREVIEQVGFLDESLSKGGVAFDDFCNRIALEGFGLVAAGDVFIHNTNGKGPLKNKSALKGKWSGIDTQTALGKKLARFNALHGARDFQQKGRIDKAVETLIEGLKVCPDEKSIYYALAETLIEAKRFSDALEALNGLPENAKGEQKSLTLFGYGQEGLSREGEAESYADRALALQPDDPLALNLKGRLFYKKGDQAAAEACFGKALKSDPGYGAPYTNLGELKWQAGEKEEALDLFEKGAILMPTNADTLSLYQTAAGQLGQLERAEKILASVIAPYPRHKGLLFSLISVRLAQGKFKEAMRDIEGAVITFGMDDGLLAAALEVRDKIGPMEIGKKSLLNGTLSVCMIVKNEEEHLARCLMSLKPVADEIIVVDTGSTDRTMDMAKAYGAKVFDFKWTEDFSQARNYSLSKAAGDWVLVHDADEVLSPLDHEKLRLILAQEPAKGLAYSLTTRNYTTNSSLEGWTANAGEYAQEEAGNGWFPTPKVRLFTNDPRVRFQNPVHELLEPSLMKAEFNIRPIDIPIHHYGELNQEKDLAKAKTYYLLGKKKLEASPNNPVALRELAIQAGELKKYDEALDLFQRYLQMVPDSHVAYFNMATCYLELEKFEQALEAARKAKELAPNNNEALLSYAGVSLCAGNVQEAIFTLEGLLKTMPEYPVAKTALAASYCIGGEKAKGLEFLKGLWKRGYDCNVVLQSISKKLAAAGRVGQAIDLLQGMIESGHVHPETQALLARLQPSLS